MEEFYIIGFALQLAGLGLMAANQATAEMRAARGTDPERFQSLHVLFLSVSLFGTSLVLGVLAVHSLRAMI